MVGLIKRTDDWGGVTYLTIVGATREDCFKRVNEMNEVDGHSEIHATFKLIATQENGVWYDCEYRKLSDIYVNSCLNKK